MSKLVKIGVGGVNKESKPFIGVGGVVKKIKAAFAGIGGVVKELWKSAFLIYDNGVELISIVQAYIVSPSGGSATYTELAGYLDLYTSGGTSVAAQIGAVTDTLIDMTNYTKLNIEWEMIQGYQTATPEIGIFVTVNKSISPFTNTNLFKYTTTALFGKISQTFDITSINGNAYIMVAVRGYPASDVRGVGHCYTYKIWLE